MFLEAHVGCGKSIMLGDIPLQEKSATVFVFEFPLQSETGREPADIAQVILFDSSVAAQEVAYALRGTWDGCTGVECRDVDSAAFELAASLVGGKWCNVGHSELIAENRGSLAAPVHSDNFFLAGFRDIASFDLRTLDFNPLELPDLSSISFPVSRAEVYWAIADGTAPMSAADISEVVRFSKSTVQGHLRGLVKAGAICGVGRPKQYTIAENCPPTYLHQLQLCASLARSMR